MTRGTIPTDKLSHSRSSCKDHAIYTYNCEACLDANNMLTTGMGRLDFRSWRDLGKDLRTGELKGIIR